MKQGFKIFGEKDQWEERRSLHMMKIFRLIFSSDQPVPYVRVSHMQHVPAFLWVGISLQLLSQTNLSGRYTSAPHPPPRPAMGRWGTDYHIVWTFEHFFCLRARPGFTAELSPVNSAGLALMIRSDTCCGLPKIKGWASCLKRYRETLESHCGY